MLILIAAMSENRIIGRDGGLPWHLPDDMRHFKRMTTGHHLIMGRRTFESFPHPLPDRVSIVITRRDDYRPPGVQVVHSLDDAIALAEAAREEEIFIGGGEEIYRQALPRADRIELTLVHARVEGDTSFPDFDESDWKVVHEEHHPQDARHEHAFTIRRLERKPA